MKKKLIRWKIYFDRARMYVGMIQSLMIVTMFIEVLGIRISRLWYPVIFILFILLSLIVGYIDKRIGLWSEEMRNSSIHNPMLQEMIGLLKEIKDSVKSEKENK